MEKHFFVSGVVSVLTHVMAVRRVSVVFGFEYHSNVCLGLRASAFQENALASIKYYITTLKSTSFKKRAFITLKQHS